MKVLEGILQGSPEWSAVRNQHFCASDAPAALGFSKYKSRNDLLREKATGVSEEIDAAKQKLFDAGHAAERDARSIVEATLSEELYPSTVSAEVDGLQLLASLDGLTMLGDIIWENKLFNAELAAAVDSGELDTHYWAQLEHQLLVTGAEKVYFTTSDGTPERTKGMWYVSIPERRASIIAAWKQFAVDVAAYQAPEVIPAVVAAPVMQLPALSIQVNGSISLIDNLKVFGEKLNEFIDGIDMKPSTDQSFADAESAIKTLQTAQDALEAAEANALAQTADIDTMRRTVKLYADQAKATRLLLNKMVTERKAQIRVEIVQEVKDQLATHIAGLNTRLGKNYMPPVSADFAGAIKGKRTIDSIRNAVDTTLANAKIAANAVADLIQINLNTLRDLAENHKFLFSDTATIVLKPNDDLTTLVKLRIKEHDDAKAKAEADLRTRLEAEAKAKAEAEVKAKADAEAKARQDEIDRKAREEERARQDELTRKEQATRTTPAPATLSATPPSAPTPPAQTVIAPLASVAATSANHIPGPLVQGTQKLRQLIDAQLGDMSAGELQQALDAIRNIVQARAAGQRSAA